MQGDSEIHPQHCAWAAQEELLPLLYAVRPFNIVHVN